MTTHHLDDTAPHAFWDQELPPRLTVEPGETVIFETLEGYCLCGATADLRISEIVNEPTWIVSAYLPLAIFH